MSGRYLSLSLLFVCLTLTSFTSGAFALILSEQEHFSVQLPEGFQIVKASPGEDFEVYTISKGTQPYLYVYVGNQPTFPKTNPGGNEISELEGLNISIRSEWKGGELIAREVLFKMPDIKGWPTRIHAWTARLAPPQLQVADRILFSLKTK